MDVLEGQLKQLTELLVSQQQQQAQQAQRDQQYHMQQERLLQQPYGYASTAPMQHFIHP